MKIHIVQDGDTLQTIAEKYDVGHDELENMNTQLQNPNQLALGMKVKVPSGGVRAKTEKAEAKTEKNSSLQTSPRSEGKANEPKLYTQQEPKYQKQEAPESSWSFHYPPTNEEIPPFPPAEEWPEPEHRPSCDFSPMYPSAFEEAHEEMQQWPQSASLEQSTPMYPYPMEQGMDMNEGWMKQGMNMNPYTGEQGAHMNAYSSGCLPQCSSLSGLYTHPMLGAKPMNAISSMQQAPHMGYYQMTAPNDGCGSSDGYWGEYCDEEWGTMPYAHSSWKQGHEKG